MLSRWLQTEQTIRWPVWARPNITKATSAPVDLPLMGSDTLVIAPLAGTKGKPMMNKKQYCQRMLDNKGRHMPFLHYLGGKWSFLKVINIGIGLYLTQVGPTVIRILGGVLIGYMLGKIALGIMLYVQSRKHWPYLNDLLDWDKVAEGAGATEE